MHQALLHSPLDLCPAAVFPAKGSRTFCSRSHQSAVRCDTAAYQPVQASRWELDLGDALDELQAVLTGAMLNFLQMQQIEGGATRE